MINTSNNYSRIKKKILAIYMIVFSLAILLFNPLSVKMLFSKDHVLSFGTFNSLLFTTLILAVSFFACLLGLILLKMGKSKFPNIIINCLLLLSVIVAFFLSIEVLCRTAFKPKEPVVLYSQNDFFDMTWHKPNLNVNLITSEYNINFRTNSVGLRDDKEFKERKIINEIRIMNLGDSFIQAAQMNLKDTMTYLLEKKLNDYSCDKRYRVFNVGTSGCGPQYERMFLEKNVSKFDLDYLFLYLYIGNDFAIIIHHRNTCEKIFDSFVYNFRRVSKLFNFVYSRLPQSNEAEMRGLVGLKRPCQPFDGKPINISGNIFLKKYNKYIDDAYMNVFSELLKIKEICNENEISYTVFIVPTKEQVEPDKYKEVIKYFKLDIDILDMKKPQRLIAELFEENEIEYVDLLDSLVMASKNKDTYFDIDSHWNMYGNKIVADTVFDYILRKLN